MVIFKVLCNNTNLNDDRIISINSYPVKLWNYYGSYYIHHRKFDVLKPIDHDIITDDKEWWNTEEMENAAITKITKRDHIWKALMIGQPFIFDGDHGYDLKSMGFKEYPWINKKVDKDFIIKNSSRLDLHPTTKSKPFSHFSTSSGIFSGGSCISTGKKSNTASPVLFLIPLKIDLGAP